ncbi:hypothetical protein B0T24DRAFT_556008 [Lasiosphaeria ovina]|uniref:Uncharacterized protein n=1 Tax=Lasiosphaeria ovina TaxID=92902 RepID=A0AAE0K8T2_9PEZI|nr:hypothetical protein B0T24DRAFT_556008 [Lasiosphaeria ovina]
MPKARRSVASAAPSEDGTLEISIQTLSLMRHPGDVTNFDEYRQHLPEQWCPMVSIIGSVPSSESNSVDPSEPRHFMVETSVYDAAKAAPIQFSVVCFLETTKRWEKVKTPSSGAFLSVTAKLAGRTIDTNRLALRVLDLTYLPRPNSGTAMPTPATTPPSKRSRWDGRAPSSTPSKKPRTSKLVEGSATPSNRNTTPPEATHAGTNLPATGEMAESPFVASSPSTAANHEESSVNSIPPLNSDNGARPHRSRHPPRKYAELD